MMLVSEMIEALQKLPPDAELLMKSIPRGGPLGKGKIIMFARGCELDPLLQMDMVLLGVTSTEVGQ